MQLRRKDPLLRFLSQARNAETHAVSATLDKPITLVLKDKCRRRFNIGRITAEFKDGTLTLNIDSPDILLNLDVSALPTDPKLMRFKNRGKWYNPPRSHLGNDLQDLHPVIAAKLGLNFYRSFVNEAAQKFK